MRQTSQNCINTMIKYKESVLIRNIHKKDQPTIGRMFFEFIIKNQKIKERFEQVGYEMSLSLNKIVCIYLMKEFPDYYSLVTKFPELVKTFSYYHFDPLKIFSSKLRSSYLKINNVRVRSRYDVPTKYSITPTDIFKNSDISEQLKTWIDKYRFSIPEIDKELNNIFAVYYERFKIFSDFIKYLSNYFIIPKNFTIRSESFGYSYCFNSIFPSFVEKNNIVTYKDLLDFDEDLFLTFCKNNGINYLEAGEENRVDRAKLIKEAEKIRNILLDKK